jgi:hypothetical protein
MSRAVLTLRSSGDRAKATSWVAAAPAGTRVEFRRAKRTLAQNDLLWQRLTEIAAQVVWHGQRLTPQDWKDMFTASLRKARVVPGIDAGSFVLLGLHTSDMSKEEMSDLLALMEAFAAQNDVTFCDLNSEAA